MNKILNANFFVKCQGGRVNIIAVYTVYTVCMFYDFGPHVVDFSTVLLEHSLYSAEMEDYVNATYCTNLSMLNTVSSLRKSMESLGSWANPGSLTEVFQYTASLAEKILSHLFLMGRNRYCAVILHCLFFF